MNMNEYDITSIEVTFTHKQSGEKVKIMCPMVADNMSITQSLPQSLSFQLNLEALLEETESSFEITWE